MRDEAMNNAPAEGRRDELEAGAVGAAGQTLVPTTLLDAVMDVDAAIDDGGLDLQDALARLHEELAPLIPGPSGAPAATSAGPRSIEQTSSRS